MYRGIRDAEKPEFVDVTDHATTTRVIPAETKGRRAREGANGAVEASVAFNLHKRLDGSRWLAFARPAKRLAVVDRIRFGAEGKVCFAGALNATVEGKGGETTSVGEVEGVDVSALGKDFI